MVDVEDASSEVLKERLPVKRIELIRPRPQLGNTIRIFDHRCIVWETRRPSPHDSTVTPFNDIISAVTGSNNAVLWLGSESSARGMCFYLFKYLTKDDSAIAASAVCLQKAQSLAAVHPSTASDSGTPVRTAQYILTKFASRIAAKCEVTPQTIFSVLLGHESEYSTSNYSYLFAKAAIRDAKRYRQRNVDGESSDSDASDTSNADVELQVEVEDGSITLADASQSVNYAHRGPHLRHMSLYEYVGCVIVQEKTRQKRPREGAGRPANKTFDFDRSHPKHEALTQKLRSLQCVPVLLQGTPPRDSQSRKNRRKVAEYIRALFFPWDKDTAVHINWSYESVRNDCLALNPEKLQTIRNVLSALGDDVKNSDDASIFMCCCKGAKLARPCGRF
eukprot:PhM_4_TR15175/c1_g1_i1/m.66981